MAGETANLNVRFEGDSSGLVSETRQAERSIDRYGREITETTRKTKAFGRAHSDASKVLKTMRRQVVSTFGAIAGGSAIIGTVRILANFSQELSTLKAVTGASGDAFKALREETKRLGATTRFSATQAAEGATFLARAGFNADEVLSSLHGTLQLAQAGALDLGRAADIASNVLQGFRLEADETGRVVNVLANAAASSNTNVEQLGNAMSFVAPAAAAVNVSLEKTAAGISALSDAGIQGERAGTALRQILIKLTEAGGEFDVQARGLIPVLETLAKQNIGLSEAVDLVGIRQASSLLVLADSVPKIRELTDEYVNNKTAVKEMAEEMDRNLNGALLAVRSAAEAVVIEFGELGAESALTEGMRGLADILRSVAKNLDLVEDAAILAATVFAVRWIPAIKLHNISMGVAIAEQYRYQVALGATVGASRPAIVAMTGLGVAANGLKVAMAFLGGPLGVITIAATAIALFATSARTGKTAAEELRSSVDDLGNSFDGLDEKARAAHRSVINKQLDEARAELARLEKLREAGGVTRNIRTAGAGEFKQGLTPEQIIELDGEIKRLNASIADGELALKQLNGELRAVPKITPTVTATFEAVQELTQAEKDLLAIVDPVNAAHEEYAEKAQELGTLLDRLGIGIGEQAEYFGALAESIFKTSSATKKMEKDSNALLDAVLPLRRATREFAREEAILQEQFEKGVINTAELAVAMQNLRKRHIELFPEVKRSIEAADELAEAWIRTTERIDTAFADAWKGAFDSFADFGKNILNAFKSLLAEMAHLAITRPILVNSGLLGGISGAAGPQSFLGGLTGGAGGGGGSAGGGGLLGGVGRLASGFGGGLLVGANQLIGRGAGVILRGASAINPHFGNFLARGYANTTALGNTIGARIGLPNGGAALGGLATVGAGFAGGFVGNALGEGLFGKTAESNYGSAAGGVAGAIIGAKIGAFGGPIGAFIGAGIGALVDVLAGGDGKKRFNLGVRQGVEAGLGKAKYEVGETVTGLSGLRIQAINRRGGDDADEIALRFRDTIVDIDAALTTLSTNAGLNVDFSGTTLEGLIADAGKTGSGDFFGLKGFNGAEGSTLEEQATDFVLAWITEINDQLPDRVRAGLDLDGTAQAIVTSMEALLGIDSLLELDVVRSTEEALDALEKANRPLVERYHEQTEAVLTLASTWENAGLDADSLVALNDALFLQKSLALDLALSYRALSESTSALLGNTIQNIRESILTEEELYNLRRSQIADLTSELLSPQTISPDEIAALVDSINALTADAYNILTEDQQSALAAEFIRLLEQADAIAQEKISMGLARLETSERDVLATIDFTLAQNAAEINMSAASTFSDAVDRWVASLNDAVPSQINA